MMLPRSMYATQERRRWSRRPLICRRSFSEKLIPGPMDAAGVEAVFQQLKKAVIERALGAEMGLPPVADAEGGNGNHRNGRSGKTVLTDDGLLRIDVPRDRSGTFEPAADPQARASIRWVRRADRSMYARGMTVREIQGHLAEMYRVEVSPEFISKVTDEVMVEVAAGRHGHWRRCIRWCSSTHCG
ncbi:MAG: transposase [Lysobacteraceae bacterium]